MMFIIFVPMAIVIGTTVVWSPMNHPLTAITASCAGTPHTPILKYCDASSVTFSSGATNRINNASRYSRNKTTRMDITPAIINDFLITSLHSSALRRPILRAVSPVVPILRNPESQKKTFNIKDPTAIAPR